MKDSPNPPRYDGRMPYRKCGRWGLKLPAISSRDVGITLAAILPLTDQIEMIQGAFDLGITHFDLANNYGPPYGSAEI